MKKTLKTTLLAACCLVVLAGCGKKTDTGDTANVGTLVNNNQNSNASMGPDSPDCPTIYEPVCTNKNITYKNACHAEKAGETGWQPGEC